MTHTHTYASTHLGMIGATVPRNWIVKMFSSRLWLLAVQSGKRKSILSFGSWVVEWWRCQQRFARNIFRTLKTDERESRGVCVCAVKCDCIDYINTNGKYDLWQTQFRLNMSVADGKRPSCVRVNIMTECTQTKAKIWTVLTCHCDVIAHFPRMKVGPNCSEPPVCPLPSDPARVFVCLCKLCFSHLIHL